MKADFYIEWCISEFWTAAITTISCTHCCLNDQDMVPMNTLCRCCISFFGWELFVARTAKSFPSTTRSNWVVFELWPFQFCDATPSLRMSCALSCRLRTPPTKSSHWVVTTSTSDIARTSETYLFQGQQVLLASLRVCWGVNDGAQIRPCALRGTWRGCESSAKFQSYSPGWRAIGHPVVEDAFRAFRYNKEKQQHRNHGIFIQFVDVLQGKVLYGDLWQYRVWFLGFLPPIIGYSDVDHAIHSIHREICHHERSSLPGVLKWWEPQEHMSDVSESRAGYYCSYWEPF